MSNLVKRIFPFLFASKTASKPGNTARPQKTDGNTDSMIIREATAEDIPALAQLHVTTFNETHSPIFKDGPKFELREYQWKEMFNATDKNWFCYVIQNEVGELIGFAKGQPYTHHELSDFAGELNKLYLLKKYHRRGLGKKLVCKAAQRFLEQGISSMLLFGEAKNPSNGFYEALEGERLYAKNGEFHGGYGWRNLNRLVANCQTA